MINFAELLNAGHRVAWNATIWNKPYVFMKDPEGTLYLIKPADGDGNVIVLL